MREWRDVQTNKHHFEISVSPPPLLAPRFTSTHPGKQTLRPVQFVTNKKKKIKKKYIYIIKIRPGERWRGDQQKGEILANVTQVILASEAVDVLPPHPLLPPPPTSLFLSVQNAHRSFKSTVPCSNMLLSCFCL